MIRRRDLVRALRGKKPVADWVIVETTQDIAIADGRRDKLARRRENRVHTSLVIHVDDSRGRGTARVEVASQDTDAGELVDRAIELATAAIGPAWKSIPAAAPAKVVLLDPAIGKREPPDVAAALIGSLTAPPLAVAGCVRVTREQIVVDSHVGLTTKWDASAYEVDALVSDGKHSIALRRGARRAADLELAAAIKTATADLALLAGADAIKPGRCELVLDADAFLHDDGTGVWQVFAAQADAALERQGLTRYRSGVPVAPGADAVDEPLTIESNGALEFGVHSAPLGDDGDAIRKFNIVERGVAKALGLSPREAALRGGEPNGGVRNLVVARGTWDGAIAGGARTVEVRRLRALTIDRYTGEASLELALALEHAGGTPRPVTGGTVRLDLIAALARARRSDARIRRGAYVGPEKLLVANAAVI